MPPLIDSSLILKAPWQRRAYRPLQGLVEAGLGVTRINQLYERCGGQGLDAPSFCQAGLEDLGVRWAVNADGMERLRALQGPVVVVANHPLGGREAMALNCLLGQARADYRIISNFIIGGLAEVRSRLIMVDPFETPEAARANLRPLREGLEYLRQGGLVGVFPAGEVSYWQAGEGRIADKPWSPQAVRLAVKTKATIVPLYFDGRNSAFFNVVARVRPTWKTALLAQQLSYGPSRVLQATLGQPMDHEALPYRDEPATLAAWLREQVYALAPQG